MSDIASKTVMKIFLEKHHQTRENSISRINLKQQFLLLVDDENNIYCLLYSHSYFLRQGESVFFGSRLFFFYEIREFIKSPSQQKIFFNGKFIISLDY
jgi:hypothetical protein